jgi:L-alanine-DL-glutamate epimerase-like enolase superfamily enzyme
VIATAAIRPGVPLTSVETSAYRIPTDLPESDGTFEWHDTTIVIAEVSAGGERGIGYTYSTAAAARVIDDVLAPVIDGADVMSIGGVWLTMVRAIRNLGRPGIASMAIAAVDTALWDLKAKLLGTSLLDLMGAVRDNVEVYGSGGFTSYTDAELRAQLEGWRDAGITKMKMKVGRDANADIGRVRAARETIGPGCALFVDANGGYTRKQALAQAERFADEGVTWFEEPVSSDDLDGLRLMRDRAPAGMDIAAGEYGFDELYFRRMLDAGAVDVLQADATRCAGFTGFLQAAALCEARSMPLSAHCAPTLHAAVCCAARPAVHVEYFHDHARIERMLFDGALQPRDGRLWPDTSEPGLGIELKRADAERYRI